MRFCRGLCTFTLNQEKEKLAGLAPAPMRVHYNNTVHYKYSSVHYNSGALDLNLDSRFDLENVNIESHLNFENADLLVAFLTS